MTGHSRLAYRRMRIEIESPEQLGYDAIENNLAESSFTDMRLGDYGVAADLTHTVLPYGDHLGDPKLRELIVEGTPLSPEDVIVTAGAASALFIAATSLLAAGSHALVSAPNYATNIETPRALGADLETIDLRFDDGWRLDPVVLAGRLRPETRLVSVTYPHNPTGSTITPEQLMELVELIEAHPTATLLVDETYRELAYGEPLPIAAALSPRVVSLSSMSKTYGLPGLRVGWLICRDEGLMETFLAAKEQIFITGPVIDEHLSARVLERRSAALELIQTKTQKHLGIVREWIAGHDVFEWVEPRAGVVCFPRLQTGIDLDVERFYRTLFDEFKTYVGPGWWFDQEPRYFRLGFAWPTEEELVRGLHALDGTASMLAR